MKTIIISIMLAAWGTVSYAQDTAYVSQDKVTALFFASPVKIIIETPTDLEVKQLESGLITVKAFVADFKPLTLNVQEENTNKLYHIPVQYFYGRAGRRLVYGNTKSVTAIIKPLVNNYAVICNQLASGKRKDVVDREKTGGVKCWVNKLSLAGNRIFFRLDIRNRSKLPYAIDFVRFYVRDLKTVARMATQEQEIIPVYSTLNKHTTVVNDQEIAKVFAFKRFSLSEAQALNIELYEKNGNRHLYLKIRQKDLDNMDTISPVQQPENTFAANSL